MRQKERNFTLSGYLGLMCVFFCQQAEAAKIKDPYMANIMISSKKEPKYFVNRGYPFVRTLSLTRGRSDEIFLDQPNSLRGLARPGKIKYVLRIKNFLPFKVLPSSLLSYAPWVSKLQSFRGYQGLFKNLETAKKLKTLQYDVESSVSVPVKETLFLKKLVALETFLFNPGSTLPNRVTKILWSMRQLRHLDKVGFRFPVLRWDPKKDEVILLLKTLEQYRHLKHVALSLNFPVLDKEFEKGTLSSLAKNLQHLGIIEERRGMGLTTREEVSFIECLLRDFRRVPSGSLQLKGGLPKLYKMSDHTHIKKLSIMLTKEDIPLKSFRLPGMRYVQELWLDGFWVTDFISEKFQELLEKAPFDRLKRCTLIGDHTFLSGLKKNPTFKPEHLLLHALQIGQNFLACFYNFLETNGKELLSSVLHPATNTPLLSKPLKELDPLFQITLEKLRSFSCMFYLNEQVLLSSFNKLPWKEL